MVWRRWPPSPPHGCCAFVVPGSWRLVTPESCTFVAHDGGAFVTFAAHDGGAFVTFAAHDGGAFVVPEMRAWQRRSRRSTVHGGAKQVRYGAAVFSEGWR
ncbi:hypothetical protein [Chondromyces crocatus]|uniref:Uncharacterized protein n=1 Tax=Chondromyces crocatus TaxID=52 RepID=A0A0K1EQ68_CHOCO|nr:hypothetical protein [Chondromyces crocatus]AKT42768.1 uncharacterized protein CMC5_069950 [Chondromyces crocatus]